MNKILLMITGILILLPAHVLAEDNVNVQTGTYSSMTGGNVTFGDSPRETETEIRSFINTYIPTVGLDAPGVLVTDGEILFQEVPLYSSDELYTPEEISSYLKTKLRDGIVIQKAGRRTFSNKSEPGKAVKIYTLSRKPSLYGGVKGKTFQVEGVRNGLLEETVDIAVSAAYSGYLNEQGRQVTGAYPFRIYITYMRQWFSESTSNGNGVGVNISGLPGSTAVSGAAGSHSNRAGTRNFYVDIVKVCTYNQGAVEIKTKATSQHNLGMDSIFIFPRTEKLLAPEKKLLARNIVWLKTEWPNIVASNSIVEIVCFTRPGIDSYLLKKLVSDAVFYTREGLAGLSIDTGDRIRSSIQEIKEQSSLQTFQSNGAIAGLVFKCRKEKI